MAKRSSRQPLYEYLRQTAGSDPSPKPEPESERVDQWLRPGRSIRIPVGYMLVAAGLVLILGTAAFIYGYHNGESSERTKIGDALFDERPGGEVVQDPLATGEQIPLTRSSRPPLFQSAPEKPAVMEQPPDPATFGLVESDPREVGLHYYVLMTTRQKGAIALAEFCRENGLEAYVVEVNNSGLSQYQVIAFPGFDERTSPRAQAVRQKINEVGRLWKGKNSRESDLRDAYPVRHR